MSERIGVILVHGVGEQKRFQYLSKETLQIIRSLQANPEIGKMSVQPRTTQDAAFAAENQTWLAEDRAPVQIDFLEKGKPKSLFIHEVWWSDLDNKISLWERLKFWGLSLIHI